MVDICVVEETSMKVEWIGSEWTVRVGLERWIRMAHWTPLDGGERIWKGASEHWQQGVGQVVGKCGMGAGMGSKIIKRRLCIDRDGDWIRENGIA